MTKPIAVDANVIVRYLTGDDPSQSPMAVELFRSASEGRISLIITTSVLQETVYALETFYNGTPVTIAPALVSLLGLPNVSSPDASWVLEGIQWYRQKNADFGDALLCAYAHRQGCDVATFDKEVTKKFTEVAAAPPPEFLKRSPK